MAILGTDDPYDPDICCGAADPPPYEDIMGLAAAAGRP